MRTNDYAARIINADPLELVVITYELIDGYLNNALAENEAENMKYDIFKARQFLSELVSSLDIEYDISKELMSIYIYANKLMVESEIKVNSMKIGEAKEKLAEAAEILDKLGEGWRAVRSNTNHDENNKSIKNTQQLYVGLTYKGGKLSEFVDNDNARVYRA